MRVLIRSYFSSHLLWIAVRQAEEAGAIETSHQGKSTFSVEHRGHVLSSIIASVAFLEAMVNELYQDAVDGHTSPQAYITPLSESCRRLMVEFWRSTREGRVGAIEKCEMLLAFADAPALPHDGPVYQNAARVRRLRNEIVHYRPEDVAADEDEAHAMERRLRGRFTDNALMAGSGNAWWPDHALGYGAATWAHTSEKALADEMANLLGIDPNYRRIERDGWFGNPP